MNTKASRYAKRLEKGEKHLASDPILGALVRRVGPCTLAPAWDREPFESLVRAVAFQQLHGRAANAILGRFIALFDPPFPTPGQILAMEDLAVRACGFSAGKIAAIRDIAAKAEAGLVPSRAEAERLDDEEIIARLVPIRGVGRWTVEMLLISTLGRLDVWPTDDFGVKNGLKRLYGLDAMPRKSWMDESSKPWQPYRSMVAWYLWRGADMATLEQT